MQNHTITRDIVPPLTKTKLVEPPQSWLNPDQHFLLAMTHPWYRLIFRLNAIINNATYEFYKLNNMQSVMLPVTTGSISSPMGLGSDSLPVQVNIGGQPTFLADSMQFMLEYSLRIYNKGVFYIMPSFRGEDADARHLCQFYHSEAEICGSLEDVMGMVQNYIKHLAQAVFDSTKQGLEFNINLQHLTDFISRKTIPRLRHEEALKILDNHPDYVEYHEAGFTIIKSAGEQELIKQFGGYLWLTHFPKMSVPFYQADEEGTEFSKCADLLMGIGETVGCGERHQDTNSVMLALKKRQVDSEPYNWYLEMRRHLPLKTSGFGLGVERLILWILKHNDIRDCQILPRINNVTFYP